MSAPLPARLDEWGGAQNCHFAHTNKAQFEAAARRVFDASSPKIYGLRPEEGGALVEQHWALDAVFASASGTERWRLEYAPAGDGVDVHADMLLTPGAPPPPPKPKPNKTKRSGDITSYQLLWSRIAYVLGNRADWPKCEAASKSSGAGLCGMNTARPPLRLVTSR